VIQSNTSLPFLLLFSGLANACAKFFFVFFVEGIAISTGFNTFSGINFFYD